MWHQISSEEDLKSFLKHINYFHDHCISEIHYKSGAYCDKRAMFPINNCRSLTVITQSGQFDVEMQFDGLISLKLFPQSEKYTCEILDASLYMSNDLIYWCNSTDLDPLDPAIDWGTVICAKSMAWRVLQDEKND